MDVYIQLVGHSQGSRARGQWISYNSILRFYNVGIRKFTSLSIFNTNTFTLADPFKQKIDKKWARETMQFGLFSFWKALSNINYVFVSGA